MLKKFHSFKKKLFQLQMHVVFALNLAFLLTGNDLADTLARV